MQSEWRENAFADDVGFDRVMVIYRSCMELVISITQGGFHFFSLAVTNFSLCTQLLYFALIPQLQNFLTFLTLSMP